MAAVWLKLVLSLSSVEEVVDGLLHHGCVYLRMAETKRAEGHWRADIQCPISTESWKTDLKESQVRRHNQQRYSNRNYIWLSGDSDNYLKLGLAMGFLSLWRIRLYLVYFLEKYCSINTEGR